MPMSATQNGASVRRGLGCVILGLALLQGCSGMRTARDAPAIPVMGRELTGAALVTPVTRRAPQPSALASGPSGLHSDVPVLMTVPAAKVVRKQPPPAADALPAQAAPAAAPVVPGITGPADGTPPAGSLLPAGLFGKQGGDAAQPPAAQASQATQATPVATGSNPAPVAATSTVSSATASPAQAPAPAPATPAVKVARARPMQVLLYASPTTRAYFAALGIDYQKNIDTWADFLNRSDIGFVVADSVDKLATPGTDVLLLPSAVALAENEKQAVAAFRDNGGSVLATWLTGVRGELGEWRGFGFMESTLNTKVLGTTEADTDDTFLMPHGDSPVTHRVAAGLRVWVERAKEWFPLRLRGANSAAEIMDWSRNVKPGKSSSVMSFDERASTAGKSSRAVVLGYPERLWLSAERSAIDPMAQDALSWLARRPDAYAATWPWPHRSALVLAIDAPDTLSDSDLRYARLAEDLGGRASYFLLTEQAAAGAKLVKDIQARGHEIAYLGDRFLAFKDQPASMQGRRLDAMVVEMKAAGIDPGAQPGFRTPMEAYDAVTERLLRDRGFAYHIGDPGSSEARLPFIAPGSKSPRPLVSLPRTQNGPDDALAEGDPVQAMLGFLEEFDLAEQMSGLSVIRIPNQSVLNDAQWADFSSRAKAKGSRMWMATATQVADWWREHERVRVSLDADVTPALLTVVVSGDAPLHMPASVLVNLPEAGSMPRLVADSAGAVVPRVAAFDAWRAALILEGLAPGTHRWFVSFDRNAGARK